MSKRTLFNKYVQMYGLDGLDKDTPILFNITGKFRDEFYDIPTRDTCAMIIAFMITSYIISFPASFVVACLFIIQSGYLFSWNLDDEQFEDIGGYKVAVAIPTREEEGRREARNFEETGDKQKLINKLDDANIYYNKYEIVVQSVGSSSTQCIYGHRLTQMTEVEMGVDAFTDEQMETFLKAHAVRLSYDGILVIMNSGGRGTDGRRWYGIKEGRGGIVYNDNKVEYDTITPSILARTVSGTGNNANAIGFSQKLVEIHKRLNLNYVLAFVPRGDKTMPKGGSHSNDRILRADKRIVVIEVSGKQTKKFELVAQDADNIKETKITDADGKTHGSMQVFG
jgi:hypothetical protein